MRPDAWPPVLLLSVFPALVALPLSAQTDSSAPPSSEASRRAAHGRALAAIGRSGLRGLLSASGNLGDLQNRAGSYRMAVRMEEARTAALEGRIAALTDALGQAGLPPEERAVLLDRRDAAREELSAVPRYQATYRTATAQAEALVPFGFTGDRPLFLLVRGRGHARWGGDDGLTVFSEGASVSPVLVASDRFLVALGLALGRTDVEIGPFDGHTGTTSLGPRMNLAGILGDGWSVALQTGHAWSRSATRIVRPGPGPRTEVRSAGWSRTTSLKAEVKGRVGLPLSGDGYLALRPRVGMFLVSTHTPAGGSGPDDGNAGPFGERETAAALRAGAALETSVGRWNPTVYVGWERELTHRMSVLVDDPDALLATVGLSWSWSRGRRIVADYSYLRGSRGLRRASELTVVLILDG